MIRIYRRRGTGHGKKAGMYKVWLGVECILPGGDRGGIQVSLLPSWDQVARAAGRAAGSRAAAPLLSAAMAIAVYRYCAALAWLERGGKTAYGGECLAALAVGAVVFAAVRSWSDGKREDIPRVPKRKGRERK